MAKQSIKLYIVLATLSRFANFIIMATYAIFLTNHGLDRLQINLVNVFFNVAMLLFEIPTGAIADVFGRKKSFVLACALQTLGFTLYAVSGTFWGFVAAEVTAAIGISFENGAFQSWLVDKLHDLKYKTETTGDIFAKTRKISLLVGTIASILGAIIGSFNPMFPWIAAAAAMLICGIVAFIKIDEPSHKFDLKDVKFGARIKMVGSTIHRGVKAATCNKAIQFLFLISLVMTVALQGPNMQWPLHLKQYFGSDVDLGFVAAAITLVLALGSGLAPQVLLRIQEKRRAIVLVEILIGAGLIATVLVSNILLVLPAFMIFELGRGLLDPIRDAYLHDNITDRKKRATIASFESMARHIGGAIGLFLSGLLALKGNIPITWITSGIFLIISTLLIAKFSKR